MDQYENEINRINKKTALIRYNSKFLSKQFIQLELETIWTNTKNEINRINSRERHAEERRKTRGGREIYWTNRKGGKNWLGKRRECGGETLR